MEMESIMGEEKDPKFIPKPKMKDPQVLALHGKWDMFKNYFHSNPADLIQPLNLAGDTAIHVAARSDDPHLIRELLNMLTEDSDRREALRMGNAHGNTLLHHVVLCKNANMVDAVLNYGAEKDPKQPGDVNDLLLQRNRLGETPLYRAAKYGSLRLLKCMARYVDDMGPHSYRKYYPSILHIAIIGHHFDVALWLLSKSKSIKDVAYDWKDEKYGLSCLQLLSSMPSVFKSYNSQAGFTHNLIYVCLPNEVYDDKDEDGLITENRDLESGKIEVIEKSTSPSSSVSSKIYYAIWKLVAEGCSSVKEIWKRKKQNMQAELVAKLLVTIDDSWKQTNHETSSETKGVLPVIQPSKVAAAKKALLLEKNNSFQEPVECKDYTPLLLAASTGIIEIVEEIIEQYPDAVSHVSHQDEQNVLHVAVKHRRKNIYKHLKKYKLLEHLAYHIASHDRNLLHQVARMDYYDGGKKPGVVFQLQEELHWFERVKKIVPGPYQLFRNQDKLTARELFDLEHSEMLKEAQEWIKGTAQSCSAVSVLVATVVFTAGYTVPGGTDGHGVPNLLNSPLFMFFAIMDVVGLATSLVSVMMFLSILTSSFQMQQFHKSIPRKLTMGFTLLFISLTSTMLAFGSTILLTIRMENKKWSSIFISVTFFPVTLTGLTAQFPIVMAIKYRIKRLRKNLKKIIPSSMIPMSTRPTCKKDYSKFL